MKTFTANYFPGINCAQSMRQTWRTAADGRGPTRIKGQKRSKYLNYGHSSITPARPLHLSPFGGQTYRQRCEKSAANTIENSTLTLAIFYNHNIRPGGLRQHCARPAHLPNDAGVLLTDRRPTDNSIIIRNLRRRQFLSAADPASRSNGRRPFN